MAGNEIVTAAPWPSQRTESLASSPSMFCSRALRLSILCPEAICSTAKPGPSSRTETVNCPFSSVELQDFENHKADRLLENFCTAITVSTASQNGKWLIHSKGPKDAPAVTGGYADSAAFVHLADAR